MKIRPLQDRVIVKRIAEEEKTKGGIIIPDTAKEKPQEGKVVAVGKGKVNEDGKVTALDVKAVDMLSALIGEHLAAGGMAILTSHQTMPMANGRAVKL